MNFKTITLLAGALLVSASATAAPIRVLGIDTGSVWDYSNIADGKLSNIVFTEASTSGFASIDLNNFDVLMVGETFTDPYVTAASTSTLTALKNREADIGSWLAAGHGIVALSEPIATNRWDWLPDSIQPGSGANLNDDTVRIVNSSHSVMAGLTSAGLSGWSTSSHGSVTALASSNMEVLVDDGAGRAITLAGTYGLGRIVLTLQDPDFHNYYGVRKADQGIFLQNAINWTSVPDSVPEPGSLVLLGLGLAGLAVTRRRRLAD